LLTIGDERSEGKSRKELWMTNVNQHDWSVAIA
jgi:hypothetical protein